MADPFVTLNGEVGEFFSRADDNLLDADSAHTQQSVGKMTGSQSSDIVALFGDFTLKGTTDGLAAFHGLGFGTLDFVEISPSTEYTCSRLMFTELSGRQGVMSWQWRTDVGGVISTATGPAVDLVPGVPTLVSHTATSPGNASRLRWQGVYQIDGVQIIPAGEDWYDQNMMVFEGSDATFVPSIRIVGDLDVRYDIAFADWSPALTQWIYSVYGQSDERKAYGAFLLSTGNIRSIVRSGDVDLQREDATGFPDGERHTVRYTRVASTGDTDVFFDEVSQGAGVSTPGNIDVISISFPFQVGAGGSNVPGAGAQIFNGDIFFIETRDGIDGPVVYRFDAADVLASVV